MITLIPLLVAILKICAGVRIVAFTSTHHKIKPFFSFLAVLLVAYFLGSSVAIVVNEQPVTLSELIMSVILTVLVFISRGNVAELFRGINKY